MSNMNFLIAKLIYFLSDTKITFSKGAETKIKSKQFSEKLTSQIMQNCPDVSLALVDF